MERLGVQFNKENQIGGSLEDIYHDGTKELSHQLMGSESESLYRRQKLIFKTSTIYISRVVSILNT